MMMMVPRKCLVCAYVWKKDDDLTFCPYCMTSYLDAPEIPEPIPIPGPEKFKSTKKYDIFKKKQRTKFREESKQKAIEENRLRHVKGIVIGSSDIKSKYSTDVKGQRMLVVEEHGVRPISMFGKLGDFDVHKVPVMANIDVIVRHFTSKTDDELKYYMVHDLTTEPVIPGDIQTYLQRALTPISDIDYEHKYQPVVVRGRISRVSKGYRWVETDNTERRMRIDGTSKIIIPNTQEPTQPMFVFDMTLTDDSHMNIRISARFNEQQLGKQFVDLPHIHNVMRDADAIEDSYDAGLLMTQMWKNTEVYLTGTVISVHTQRNQRGDIWHGLDAVSIVPVQKELET